MHTDSDSDLCICSKPSGTRLRWTHTEQLKTLYICLMTALQCIIYIYVYIYIHCMFVLTYGGVLELKHWPIGTVA